METHVNELGAGHHAAHDTMQWGAAELTRPGEAESGDRYVVEFDDRGALVAVIDALGHGSNASYAADVAAGTVRYHGHERLEEIIELCHERLRHTRGATISLARIDCVRGSLQWLGVGNVAGVLINELPDGMQRRHRLFVRSGVVGDYQLPQLRCSEVPLGSGARLVIATDGVRGNFADAIERSAEPQLLAERILAESARGSDDALVLVVDCGGGA